MIFKESVLRVLAVEKLASHHERGYPYLMTETKRKVEPRSIRGEHGRDLAWTVGQSCLKDRLGKANLV